MKSKIKVVHEVKPWSGPNGTVFYHNLEMENGDKMNIGKVKEMVVGEELEYEFTGDAGAQEFTKAKTPKNDSYSASPERSVVPVDDDVRQRLIVRQSSLNRAVEYYSSIGSKMEEISPQEVMTLADEFTNWVFKV